MVASEGHAYNVALEVLRRVASGQGTSISRMGGAVDAVCTTVQGTLGMLVTGHDGGWDVRVLESSVGQGTPTPERPVLRVLAARDPLLWPVLQGDDTVTTLGRAVGPGWSSSLRAEEIRRVWGVNQIASVPVRVGPEFVTVFVGRLGEDFSPDELDLLRGVQPVLVYLFAILDPAALPEPAARLVHLTEREATVLDLLAQGHTAARIGHLAQISPRTVHHHLANIYAKLAVGDRLSAVNRGRQLGLIPVGQDAPT
ncbi:hypothetical protein GCM10023341_13470 [Ornithinimicrobium tianjinense]